MHTVPRSVRNWLIVVAGMIFFMIVLGALTRLTESGLSMVEWKPVTGVLPPMSEAAWQQELQKYLSSPQGKTVGRDFTVGQFQQIYWLEFLHRLLGRVIGAVFAFPLAWFWLRGKLSPRLKPRLLVMLVLGVLALLIRARRSETYAAAAMAAVQMSLGIATILTGVDITLAAMHQAGAVLLLTTLIVVRHRAMPSRERPLSAMVGG